MQGAEPMCGPGNPLREESGNADVNSSDYYKVLGVSRTATDADIVKAYRRLALKHHPDKNPDDRERAEDKFKRVTEAYEVLHDPDKRKDYDVSGSIPGFGGFEGFPSRGAGTSGPSGRRNGSPGNGMSYQHADDLFKMFFGGGTDSDPFSGLFADAAGPFGGVGSNGGFGPHSSPYGGANRYNGSGMSGMSGKSGMPGHSRFTFGDSSPSAARAGYSAMGFGNDDRDRRRQSGLALPTHVVQKGTDVMVFGLTKSTEHNGKVGKVIGWDDIAGRYDVDGASFGTISLRPHNVLQLCTLELCGIDSRPELNGRIGEVFSYDESNKRYMVRLVKPNVSVAIEHGNCILRHGTRIVVQGLTNAQFNGKMAQIIGVDRMACRYTVSLADGRQIKVKYDNVMC